MTASQQPDAERAPLTSPAAAGSGSTGHDKAVEIGREIGRFHRPTSVSVVRQSVTCQCGVESTDTDGLERHRAELSLAALRAALAAGDADVAEALGLTVERQWPQERRLFVEHEGHPYGLDRYWHPCPACNPIEGEFEWIDRRRFVTDWTEVSGE